MTPETMVREQDENGRALADAASAMLEQSAALGATEAEVWISQSQGHSAQVRMGQVEEVEFNRDTQAGITLYLGKHKGSTSTNDISEASLQAAVKAARDIARFTAADEYAGLADADLMASRFPDLDLDHPLEVSLQDTIEIARAAEQAGLASDPRIGNSEGAGFYSHRGIDVYANSHGFVGSQTATRHSLSCTLIAAAGDRMQRDYWFTVARDAGELQAPEAVGREAAGRALKRLELGRIAKGRYPVLFAPEVARGLLGHYLNAVRGGNLYRRTSFLVDSLGQQLFPEWLSLVERPHLPRGLASAAFDQDGVATRDRQLVHAGRVEGYILSAYSARRLGMATTGNAGGVHNVHLQSPTRPVGELLREMDTGLLVTEVMGQGVNLVTGDYSRGASGFWVEGGQIRHFVEEITIAGNLGEMFAGIRAVGDDPDYRSSVVTGSLLLSPMMIAA